MDQTAIPFNEKVYGHRLDSWSQTANAALPIASGLPVNQLTRAPHEKPKMKKAKTGGLRIA